jgi:2-(S-pantetheinyl)-carbapenam-3-carboxylate methyltransferase
MHQVKLGNSDQDQRSFVQLTRSAGDRVRAKSVRHVMICEPQLISYGLPYLPAMWGLLKTYWEQHAQNQELIHWHDPIYRMDPPDQIAEPLQDQPIDVLGLSCYTWNWRLQIEIAKRIKASHPHCLVIAGGPHPDYSDPDFFAKHPFIDAVVVKDGEIPFTRILQRVLSYPELIDFNNAGRPMDDIPGLCLPKSGGTLTSPSELPTNYDVSSYLTQKDYYEKFIKDHPSGVVAAWETSRGCPFRCSYCDWGSSTMSKVRRFSMDRLNNEIDWFGANGIAAIFSVDSNFGMFKTDIDLTESIVQSKHRTGYPKFFIYSNAKNVPDRTVEITRKVVRAELDTAHTLSIQHSSLEVLEATDRENISVEKQIKVVRALQDDGVPISVQLILGLPKDTPALWRKSFTDMMEWGIHDGYTITNYHLLPNAPAAAPEYRAKWDIKGLERYIYDGVGIRDDEPMNPLTFARGEVIVSTSSFTRDDWVEMSLEGSCIRGLHNAGLTQSIARYLRSTHGIGYHEFYCDILDHFLPNSAGTLGLLSTLRSCYHRFLTDENYITMLPAPGCSGVKKHVEPHRWFYASVCVQADTFYRELTEHLANTYPDIDRIDSLCRYQKSIVVLPTYDAQAGKLVAIDHDWVSYFAQPDTRIPGTRVADVESVMDSSLVIQDIGWDDKTGRQAYNWPVGRHEEAWLEWFNSIATSRISETKCNHQLLKTVKNDALANTDVLSMPA